MYKPRLYELDKDRELISNFCGYDCNTVIQENLFNDEKNMSSDNYPTLSPRNKRAFFNVEGSDISPLHSKSKLCYIKDGFLYYGGEKISTCYFSEQEEERKFVSMGARLIVFPDKVYINTNDFSDYGNLEAFFSGEGAMCSMCRGDGTLYENYTVSETEPVDPENGDLWLDTSSDTDTLKQYSESVGMWIDLASVYVRIQCSGIGIGFNIDDGIFLEGFSSIGLDGAHIIRDKGDDYITVSGILKNAVTINDTVTVSRKVPHMDFICECGNRLWGCSSENNEIYASALGDPKNFNCFRGISTDSYAVSVGSDGEFTGAISYRGYILFFKEGCVHKIYGTNPPYTVTTTYIRGLQKGSHKSLVCLNETLYYKSPTGICAYEGGVPISISSPLGNNYYTNAVAGAYLNKYYICMTDVKGKRNLFSFDTERRIWHKEDDIDIRSFANNNCNLYFTEFKNGVYKIGVIDGENMYGNFTDDLSGFSLEDEVEWYALTGLWGLGNPENKYYGGLLLRASGEKGSEITISYDVNSECDFNEIHRGKFHKTGSILIPVTMPRCDHMQLKISGKGKAKLFSIMRKIESGSDEYV